MTNVRRAPRAGPGGGTAQPQITADLPWVRLTFLSVVLGLLVALDQVSRLAASVLDAQGNAWPLSELMGPSAWVSRAGWVADFGGDALRRSCLTAYVLLDLLLVATYVAAGVVHARRRLDALSRRFVVAGVVGVAVLDLAEDVLALVVGHRRTVPVGLADALARLSTAKFVLGAVVVVVLAWGWSARRRGLARHRAGRAYESLRQHRLSVIPVVLLGVLLVAPGADILDQVPDVVRRWADGPANFFLEGGLGVVALVVLTGALFMLGRARTTLACRRLADESPTSATSATDPAAAGAGRPGLWLVAPAGILVVAAVLALAGAPVQWDRLLRFCAVPVLVWLASLGLRRLARSWRTRHGAPLWTDRVETSWTLVELQRLLVVGDVVALAVVALAAIGTVRAMTAVAVLEVFGLLPGSPYAVTILVVGALLVLAWWPLVGFVAQTLRRTQLLHRRSRLAQAARWLTPTPGRRDPAMLTRLPAVILTSSVLTFLGLGTLPGVASRGGVLFVLVLGLTALTGITAGASLVAGRYPAAEVFRAARLRSTPVVTLLLAAVVFAGEIDAGTPIHAVRSAAASVSAAPLTRRPDLPTTVRTWADAQLARGCTRRVEVGGRRVDVLPMVLLASEGGGIRAAYWTVQATRPLATDACAAHATVFSSGVSGGAVGLAVARYDADPTAVVRAMSSSRALANGLIGLLVRDFTYAATGVPLPLLDRSDPVEFVDRAGLIEDVWNSSTPTANGWRDRVFAAPSTSPTDAVRPVVGPVVLNSMSVGNACRVWVSEIALRATTEDVGGRGDGKIDCDTEGVSGLRSVDLLSAYSAAAPGTGVSDGSVGPGCLAGLRASTAALLAARFPYVTPSGRVGPCPRGGRTAPADQLVDGGYLEDTGLGTVGDTSDVWLPAVQQWNADHAGAPDGSGRVVVAPVVVYLDNHTGNDQHAPQRDITSEALLPPLAKLRAGSGAVANDATLQRAADAVEPERVCGPTDPVCRQALATLPHPVFRVFPGTRPQVAAPLGWILSESSRRSMDDGVAEQLATSCPPGETYAPRPLVCRDGSGTLRDLLGLVARP